MPIATKQVTRRRELHFSSLDEVLLDAETITAGNHSTLGNWSAGQILMHLARTMDSSIDGGPFRPPWPVRLLGRLIWKRRILKRGMPAGFKLPELAERHLVPGPTTVEAGLKALREAMARLATTSKRAPHGVFGPLTVDEWNRLHCRHAELHLSFIVPQSEGEP